MSNAPFVEELVPAPDPARCCERLASLPYRLFLDSAAKGTRLGRYSFLMADPVAVVRSKGAQTECLDLAGGTRRVVYGDALDAVRALLAPHAAEPVAGLPPFQGGAAGYLAYDWGRVLERLPAPRHEDLAIPDVVFGVYDWVLAWDHEASRAWLISTGLPVDPVDAGDNVAPATRTRRAAERAAAVLERLRADSTGPSEETPRGSIDGMTLPPRPAPAASFPVADGWWDSSLELRSSFTHGGYLDAVARVREYIFGGDIFQANLSQRFEAPLGEPTWTLYLRLRTCNAAPFAAYLDFPDVTVLSASPERFLNVDVGGHVETRPIKGTRPRGVGPEHDLALGVALAVSAKDQAENLMIVDLMRNDLSRVCAPGTVRVAELFGLEHYATVHHLVSTVVGDLTPGTDALDLLRASFPGGSITGAPKVRAMEIITELEPSERGVYCGSIGYWSVTGAFDSSIAIRTVVALGGRLYFSAGGGIVADSDPEQEYRETLDKARGMIDALEEIAEIAEIAVILLIDNYDSFVHNLARYVRELGGDAVVRRNDAVTIAEIEALAPSHIIISPGPCSPAEAGISNDLIRRFGPTIPIFGVCLGHQCIGAAYGGDVVRAGRPRHGRTSLVTHDGSSVFAGVPSPLRVARYHSLVIARTSLPPSLRVIASSSDDGEIMAVEHREHPVVGVQFHPESAATEYGYAMLDRFLHGARSRLTDLPTGADGGESVHRGPETTLPWARRDDDGDGAFVPPPVDLVR